jgi:hypothetical protein
MAPELSPIPVLAEGLPVILCHPEEQSDEGSAFDEGAKADSSLRSK